MSVQVVDPAHVGNVAETEEDSLALAGTRERVIVRACVTDIFASILFVLTTCTSPPHHMLPPIQIKREDSGSPPWQKLMIQKCLKSG